jgi:hypothetical protein
VKTQADGGGRLGMDAVLAAFALFDQRIQPSTAERQSAAARIGAVLDTIGRAPEIRKSLVVGTYASE